DECRRTQQGNNNAYCQDNDISWFDWSLVERHAELERFCRALIAFRKRQPTIRRASFLRGEPTAPGLLPDVTWFSADGGAVAWEHCEPSLICLFGAWPASGPASTAARHVMLLVNAGDTPREFHLPPPARGIEWRLFVDTAAESPNDIYPDADGPKPKLGARTLIERSLVCYVAA
ncbi:MAG TPA: glycogen debranching enzyme, partial [Pirellulales bacterium]|nr:glycogen debranching enzyme [Pirellulales bacterium]